MGSEMCIRDSPSTRGLTEAELRELERENARLEKINKRADRESGKIGERENARERKEAEKAAKREARELVAQLKREAREERKSVAEVAKLERQRLKDEKIAGRERERALRRDLARARRGDRSQVGTLRRARKLGLDVAEGRELQLQDPTLDYRWSVESGQRPATATRELDYDWKAAGLPEPLPERL